MAMEDASTCRVSGRDATDRPRTPHPAERSTVNGERRASQHRLYRREPLDSFPSRSARAAAGRRRNRPVKVSTDPANPASEVSIDPGRLPLRKGRKAGELVDGDRGEYPLLKRVAPRARRGPHLSGCAAGPHLPGLLALLRPVGRYPVLRYRTLAGPTVV